jgi:hypothetical protein
MSDDDELHDIKDQKQDLKKRGHVTAPANSVR